MPAASGTASARAVVLEAAAGEVRGRFGDDGVVEIATAGGASVRVALAGWGREGAVTAPTASTPFSGPGQHPGVRREAGDATEWWEARDEGLEQGFDLSRRPPGDGPLRLWLALDAVAVLDDGAHGATLRTARGDVRCEGLVATDARGRVLEARMEPWEGGLALRVEDGAAEWPVRVDPLYAVVQQNVHGNIFTDFGLALAVLGDVNGDGCDDVAAGAPDAGTTSVYLGCQPLPDGGLGMASSPFAVLSGSAGDGARVAGVGDVNGDGFADVAVANPAASANSGKLDVYLGGAAGVASGGAGFARTGAAGAEYGADVAPAGDVNADGYSDLFVGAPGAGSATGYVTLLLGGASGLTGSTTWDGPAVGARFGHSLSGLGDVNADGYMDLLVGAPSAPQVDGGTGTGRALLYLGKAGGLNTTAAWSTGSTQAGSQLGTSLALVGDVDGDGFVDALVGEPRLDLTLADGGAGTNTGRSYLFPGSPSGLAVTAATWVSGTSLEADMGFRVGGMGDFNGDGYADVQMAADHAPNGALADAGILYVYAGTAGASRWAYNGGSRLGSSANTRLGRAPVVRGDISGDGLADHVYGNPAANRFTFWPGLMGHSGVHSTVESSVAGAQFGSGVGSGDFNGDGYTDLAVGAPGWGSAVAGQGRALVYPGGVTTRSTTGLP